jgi:hypothetical protein
MTCCGGRYLPIGLKQKLHCLASVASGMMPRLIVAAECDDVTPTRSSMRRRVALSQCSLMNQTSTCSWPR